jgi:hypothetical protein
MKPILGAVLVSLALGFYVLCFNHTRPYEAGIVWDFVSGELSIQEPNGGAFHLTAPWVRVAVIDTRPSRVCVTSATRAFNCKLVQFNWREYKEFVQVQGFHYYWLANRLSFNIGYSEEYRGVRDILRGYAFGSEQYPFITVLRELNN